MAQSFLASATIFTTSAAATVGLLHSWDIGLFGYGIVTTVKNMHNEKNINKFEEIGNSAEKRAEREKFLREWMEKNVCKTFNSKMAEEWSSNKKELEEGVYKDLLMAIKEVCDSEPSTADETTLKNILYGIKKMSKHDANNEKLEFQYPPAITNTQ